MEPREVFLGAIKALEERGHAKGRIASSDGRVCTMGAFSIAISGAPWDSVHSEDFRKASTIYEKRFGEMCEYNNTHNREEVIAAIQECADAEAA